MVSLARPRTTNAYETNQIWLQGLVHELKEVVIFMISKFTKGRAQNMSLLNGLVLVQVLCLD